MRGARLLSALLGALLLGPACAQDEGRVLVEWTFDQAGDLQGWRPNAMLADVRVADGALHVRATDWDPFLTSPTFEFATSPWQWIDIRMKASAAGRGDVFFSNTLDSPYEGFFPEKHVAFSHPGGDDWQTVRIEPFWQGEKKIIHIRLDLWDAARYEIDSIRIMEPTGAADAVTVDAWSFADDAHDWTASHGLSTPTFADGAMVVDVEDRGGLLRSPLLNVPLEDRIYVAVTLRAEEGERASLVWASDEATGLQSATFPIRPDGRFHTYNIDVATQATWQGTLLALGLRPSHTPGDRVEIKSIALTEDPIGPADLEPIHAGLTDAVNRVGRPATLAVKLMNRGAEDAAGIRAELTLPEGVRVESAPEAPLTFEYEIPDSFRWQLIADRPVEGEATVRLSGPGAPPQPLTVPLRITAAPDVPAAEYVPVPQPCRTDYEVGTYYFPGWGAPAKWEPIERVAPIRKPVLGWYDEADPEIADWQIKWAVEHGVTFWLVDWYWNKGQRHLEHWLHDAFFKARYRDMMKWAVMWANHNPAGSHSEEDWRAVTQYWIDHYLAMDNYLHVDGKPAVFIWSPGNIRRDVGGSENAAKLYAMSQQMARDAGLPGITFVAMNISAGAAGVEQVAAEGYAGETHYHGWYDAPQQATDRQNFPFSLVVDRSAPGWVEREKVVEGAGLRYLPVADTGWDSRPWHGDRSMVIHSRTADQFERLLADAKQFLDQRDEKMLVLGPWNEWGEGSYIEPNAEFGFDMLDAIRDVFCTDGAVHTDVAPIDVGLGPYDFPATSWQPRTAWTFDTGGDGEGWGMGMGMTGLQVADGSLYVKTTTQDPAFAGPVMNTRAQRFPYAVVRMKTSPSEAGQRVQLFWNTATARATEATSMSLPLQADGEWHTYVFPLHENPRWRGVISTFRLDPGNVEGLDVWVDEIRLAREAPTE